MRLEQPSGEEVSGQSVRAVTRAAKPYQRLGRFRQVRTSKKYIKTSSSLQGLQPANSDRISSIASRNLTTSTMHFLTLAASALALAGAAVAQEAARFGLVSVSPSTVKPGEVTHCPPNASVWMLIAPFARRSLSTTTRQLRRTSPSTTTPTSRASCPVDSFSPSICSRGLRSRPTVPRTSISIQPSVSL